MIDTKPSLGEVLEGLTAAAWRARIDPKVHYFARQLTDRGYDRQEKMRLIIDDLHRRFVYAPDPVNEVIGPVSIDGGSADADDMCLFVATVAMSVGIPCRFVGAFYLVGRQRGFWTLLLSYESEDGSWKTVDVLRQTFGGISLEQRGPDESVMGPIPGSS